MNIFQITTLTVLAAAAVSPLLAQAAVVNRAILIKKDGAIQTVWVTAASKTTVRFRPTEQSTATQDIRRSDLASVYLVEPESFTTAMDQYKEKDYATALKSFVTIKDQYKSLVELPGNYSTLAAYYEMECQRLLGNYGTLNDLRARIDQGSLLDSTHIAQIELDALWMAFGEKGWDRVEIIGRQELEKELTVDQRVQAAYCYGIALEQNGKPQEALNALNRAVIGNSYHSIDLSKLAVIAILRIHDANPALQKAMETWGTENENPTDPGRAPLIEAGSVAGFYSTVLAPGEKAPAEVTKFLKYETKPAEAN